MKNEHCGTDVDGTAKQGSSLDGSTDDAVQVWGSFSQFVHLRHPACEVFEALRRAPTRESLVTAVQPGT